MRTVALDVAGLHGGPLEPRCAATVVTGCAALAPAFVRAQALHCHLACSKVLRVLLRDAGDGRSHHHRSTERCAVFHGLQCGHRGDGLDAGWHVGDLGALGDVVHVTQVGHDLVTTGTANGSHDRFGQVFRFGVITSWRG